MRRKELGLFNANVNVNDCKLQVGDLVDGGNYNLTVRGTGGLNFENTTELVYSAKSSSILIQTDKPIYKPGRYHLCYTRSGT